jgi:Uma2 family endonuclease
MSANLQPRNPIPLHLPPSIPEDAVMRFSVARYHDMIRAGLLTTDDQVELLEGLLITKMPKSPRHRMVTKLVRSALEAIVPSGWYVDSQEPITLGESEPEPDAVVVRGETRDFFDRHPEPKDLALVVEVSDSTLDRDRGLKRRMYAQAGITAYWIVNLVDNQVEVHTGPTSEATGATFAECRIYEMSESVPVFIEACEVGRIAVGDLLGR